MRFIVSGILALWLSGCSAQPPGPAVGSKVVMPRFEFLYSSPENIHREGTRPEMVNPGDLVEVTERGSDYVAVVVIRDHKGNPGKYQGFVKPWWK